MTAMVHSPARALDVGSVIADTYTIEGLIGKGGMGAVFMASHARLPGKKVAIKVLHPDVADGEAMARFKREAEIASRLGHPNIVAVHDWNELADGTPYIVYELLDGESLADRLRRAPLSFDEAMSILRQVGSALAAAHREGIVHRDLKPQNIFLVQADDGVSVKAKVLDFGISKIRGSTTVKTQDTAMLGTPQYMAPEQATGQHQHVDGRTDVFALGAVVYEMFAGAPAFQGTTIPEVVFKVVYEETPSLADKVPGLPPHVVAGVHRALAKKSADRWDDVGAFVEALTGSPLASGKRNLVPGVSSTGPASLGVGTGSGAKSTGAEAMAATVGSGDHASAMAASVRASMAAAQTLASSDSGNTNSPLAPVTPPPGTPALQVSTDNHVIAPTPPPGSKTRTIIVVSVTVLTIAAAVLAVLIVGGDKKSERGAVAVGSGTAGAPHHVGIDTDPTRGSGTGTGTGAGTGGGYALVGSAPDAGITDDAVRVTKVDLDAGLTKAKPDAGTVRVKPDAGAGSGSGSSSDGPDDDEQDPELRKLLADAYARLGGDDEGALKLAKKITNDFPKVQAGWAIRAQAHCGLLDQEAARSDLRRVTRSKLIRATKQYCRKKGIEL